MHILAFVLMLLCLGSCGSNSADGQTSVYRSGWAQDRQVQRDVEAIVRGIERARAENDRLARAARDPGSARPGS
ncbi:MAG: hypothetical protein J0H67_08245 [Rhodospirillales bacterium]|nr:hypothetical protein [Rhodospirillales bacterium]